MTLKHVLKFFSKKSVDLLFPRPLREREELLSERSELSNSGEGCISCAKHTEKDLSSNRPIVLTTLKKCAFTLAEVLITLGIIGVVAAMTLPTLIQNHQKQTYVNGLKKAISATSNMLKKMQADEEASSITATSIVQDGLCVQGLEVSECNTEPQCQYDCYGNELSCTVEECERRFSNGCEDVYGNPSVFERLVPKYLKVVKTCKGSECNEIEYNDCNINQNKFSCNPEKTTFASIVYAFGQDVVGFYTSDGMIYYLIPGNMSLIVFVDVNGKKGPNQKGRDLFSYGYCMGENGRFGTGESGESVCWGGNGGFVGRIMSNGWKMDY